MKFLLAPAVLLFITQCGPDRSEEKRDAPVHTPSVEQDKEATLPSSSEHNDHASAPAASEPSSTESETAAERILARTHSYSNKDAALTIHFQPKVGGEPLACFDRSEGMLQKSQIFTDVRIFISNVTLIDDRGQEHRLNLDVAPNSSNLQFVDQQKNSMALLNFLDPSCASSDATAKVKMSISGVLPRGNYQHIRFQLGLPYPASAPELASMPSAMAPSDMGWMWQHFPADLQIEMNTGSAHGAAKKILNVLTTQDKRTISLPIAYAHQQGGQQAIALNLDFSKIIKNAPLAFVTGVEKACNNSTKPLTAEAEYCAHAYQALGLAVSGVDAPREQSVFSIAK